MAAASDRTDWQPYRWTAVVFVLALSLNMATGNRLWLGYTLTGSAVFVTLIMLVHKGRLRVPRASAWLVGVGVGLHYLGGSMAGVHRIGGVNGLYAAFPWWDNMVHFLGSFTVAVAAWTMVMPLLSRRWVAAFLAACVAMALSNLVELYEFTQFVLFGTVDQGFYTNTVLDLYYNMLGGVAGAVVAARWGSDEMAAVLPARADATVGGIGAEAKPGAADEPSAETP